jgi:hypothetical protein
MGIDLRGLSKNGRAVHWTLEMAPSCDGWESAEAGGWLMTGERPGLMPASVAALKTTLRSLERRGAVQLRTGTDGRLYARHASRAGVPTETRALLGDGRLRLYVWETVFTDFTPGLAVALAYDDQEARRLIARQYVVYDSAMTELSGQPQVIDPGGDTQPQAWYVSGGG